MDSDIQGDLELLRTLNDGTLQNSESNNFCLGNQSRNPFSHSKIQVFKCVDRFLPFYSCLYSKCCRNKKYHKKLIFLLIILVKKIENENEYTYTMIYQYMILYILLY